MNQGHWWSPQETLDLTSLARGAFMDKYPMVSPSSYRHKLADQKRILANISEPPEMDGLYHAPEWNYVPSKPVAPNALERHININDTHGVFVDQPVWRAVLDFIRDFKPGQINLLGDIVDFYDISRFSKDPTRRVMLKSEIEFTRDVILSEVRAAAPRAKIIWIEGNHEERLQRYLWRQAPELAGLSGLDISEMFKLDKLNITYQTGNIRVGDIELTHGHLVRKWSAYSAKAMFEEYGTSIVHGHTHRLGAYFKTDRSGDYVAYENGCLCTKQMEYISGVPNWQHGLSVGWVLPEGRFHFEQVAIIDGRFIYGGKMFGAKGADA